MQGFWPGLPVVGFLEPPEAASPPLGDHLCWYSPMYLAVMTSVNAMAQLMIVDMDGLPMSPGSATALLFLASFKNLWR
ncbi:hypothetical protein QO004_003295 [Rhizobium mesoamericanum]|nr:hypothetical protein [Rhizobium mesoamericanum]